MARHDVGEELRLTRAELLRILDGGTVAGTRGENRVFDTRFLGARPRQPESSIAQSEILWK